MRIRDIKMKIHEESELYSPMDPDQMILSDDVASYLERAFLNKHRALMENYVITIISDTPVDKDHATRAIKQEFERQKDDIRFGLMRLMQKMVCLAALGVALLALWLYLAATTESVGVEILSIMGWVCVWEATSIAIMQRPELRIMQKNLDRLTHAEIVVQSADSSEENDRA